jgi:XTP/dITP diphosphohydrolase
VSRIGPRLVLATHNEGKRAEMEPMLAPFGIEVLSAGALGLPEPEETGTTFAQNALLKARAAAEASQLPALADDSGLEVDALGGEPGVRTADWAETPRGRDFGLAMRRVAERLPEGAPRTARFRATLCLAWPSGEDRLFEGAAEGRLVWPPRGDGGHGYDPMFVPAGHERTFGEMTAQQKAPLSHRGAAFAGLAAWLRDG